MNIEITSVAHKEQRAGDVAAAVYVITQEDIRRSGMTTVPELLRLVPGVQVAQINSNKWAVALRGFNNLFAGKVLVLIDGRTMYDRLNSGVFWESLDVPLELIDRIEVIRGPGGATWGANAVNGVINIITKSADATAGASATVRAGTFEGTHAAARYGGETGKCGLSSGFAVVGPWRVADRREHPGRRHLAQPDPRRASGLDPDGRHPDGPGGRDVGHPARSVSWAVGPRSGREAAVPRRDRHARIPRARELDAPAERSIVAGGAIVRQLPAEPRFREPAPAPGGHRRALSHQSRRASRRGHRRRLSVSR